MEILKEIPTQYPLPVLPGAESDGEEVAFHGQIYRIRLMSGFAFVIIRTAGELVQTIYDPACAQFAIEDIHENDTVRVFGRTKREERSKRGYDITLDRVEVLSSSVGEAPLVINKKQVGVSLETLLDYRSFTLRNQYERSIFKIQEAVARAFREYLTRQDFTEIHTPKIVYGNAEGGANIFKLDYFGKQAYLAQSPQLYKQAMVGVFERVFEVGPVFRAERHDTSRHLNEYTGLDFEMGYIDSFEDLIKIEIGFLKYLGELLQSEYATACEELKLQLPNTESFVQIGFLEAKELMATAMKRKVTDYHDFEPAEEQALCEYMKKKYDADFVFVTHYPSDKRPFYAMDDPENPGYTLSFDLLFRGLEVTTGGQRIHDYDEQVKKMEQRGMNPEEFTDFLLIHKTGMPPHGGLGIGLERLAAKLIGFDNVRRACLYPRDINRLTP